MEEWRTAAYRQSMIRKIDEQMQQLPASIVKTATDMENHLFIKSRNKEEYGNYINKIMLVLKNKAISNNMQGSNAVQKGMQDPIGALQSLARQGTANNNNLGMQGQGQNLQNLGQQMGQNQNVATNLLQTLNQQRPGQTINIQQAMHNKMSGMTMLQNQQINMNQMGQMQNMQGSPMMAQMNQGIMPQQMGPQHGQQQMGPQMGPNQMQQVMQNQMQNQTINHQMSGPMNTGIQSTLQSQPSPSQQQQQHVNQMSINQMQQQQMHMQRKPEMMNAAYPAQRNITPNQFLRKSPSPSAPSPSGLGAPGSNQMVPSPALVPSPNPQLLGGQRSMAMAPSPSSSLNTPAGMLGGAVPSPDDQISQACKEKIQKLRKYIDPLNKMILKLTNDGHMEKISKMKKLLELLTNPNSITKLDVLQKCEVVLEKMDFRKYESSVGPTISSNLKEHQFLTPLLEVVGTLLQSSSPNHTLYRTFGPCVEALNGPEVKNLPPPLKKQKTEETPSEIPDVLQGEIARLDQRFKVSLDPAQQNGSKCIQLICWLDDKHLPCVPPVLVIVPTDYPTVPPKCVLSSYEYATPYLSSVQRGLDARLSKLPKRFSISQLLDNWEMSVRQACSPKVQKEQKEIEEAARAEKMSSILSSTAVTASTSLTNGIPTNLIDSVAS